MRKIKISTFNVNSLKARLPIVRDFLSGGGAPDILCFQETKCRDEDFPLDFFESLGYRCSYSGMKSYNGVAIASREQPDRVAAGFDDGSDIEQDRARILRASFGDLDVVCTYVPQGKSMDNPDFAYKKQFLARIRALFERDYSLEGKMLWTGDLNVIPTDMDVVHPENKRDHVCVCDEIRAALESVTSWGLVDVFRKHRPQAGEFSFWDYRVRDAFARNIGWRLDHLFATPGLERHSVDAYVVRDLRAMERPSDHTAVTGVFEV
ncbi:MAG: exodeoxyribonuclease III [Synergistaceae bacterium]|jgi:exodeoxyribonuclease-3|nr:exodeoxyribonuclease III [Synergistaceae bacterium]